VELYGFTLLRNGIKYDYPFRESLSALSQLCREVYVALGSSEDGTERALEPYPNLVITPTVWDENLRQSGVILSQQTNIALAALRARRSTGWAIYLQADEVLDDAEFPLIRRDLARAEAEGCDAVSFRYLHFWQSYERIAVAPRWYPQEIRAIRVDSALESYGDAQSFRTAKKVFASDAHVFHYGHVREQAAYARKLKDFHRWWHSDEELPKIWARGEKKDKKEKTLPYLGPHPSFMASRIPPAPKTEPCTLLVYGEASDLPAAFWQRVEAQLEFTLNPRDLLRRRPEDSVCLRPLPWPYRWFSFGKRHSRVGRGMGSPQARPWTPEFRTLLLFSERGISVRK
jgi:hypothetical protein